MTYGRLTIMVALILALGCGGGPSTTTKKPSSSSEFTKLCQAVGAEGGQITREQFLAKAKDKDTAAKLFDACEANRDRILNEEEAPANYLESLKGQVIRIYTPR